MARKKSTAEKPSVMEGAESLPSEARSVPGDVPTGARSAPATLPKGAGSAPAALEVERKRLEALERTKRHQAATKAENARMRAEREALNPRNPLFDLPEKDRAKLFAWLRECPYDDAVQHLLAEMGVTGITMPQLNDFFQIEAEEHWEKRISRAAVEANALVRLVEENPVRFSSGILAALGQEAFRQIASGAVEPEAMNKIATLFLRARADERADQMQELKREKLRREMAGRVEIALEKFAEDLDSHPGSRAIFEDLQRELRSSVEVEA